MVTRVVTHDDVTGDCELRFLNPYPTVEAGANITVTSNTDATGLTTYTVEGPAPVLEDDVSNVNITYDPASRDLTVTVTEGGVNVSDDIKIPIWETQPDTSDMTLAEWGLGRLVNPLRTQAHPVADLLDAEALLTGASITSLTKILTNKADEATADGVSNANGSLGWWSIAVDSATTDLDDNGGRIGIISQDFMGSAAPIADGKYVGHTLLIEALGTEEYVDLTGNFRGVVRDTNNVIDNLTSTNTIRMRPTEQYWARWNGSEWVLTGEHSLFNGADWAEQVNGTVTVSRNTLAIPAGSARVVNLPQTMANANYQVQATVFNATQPVQFSPVVLNKATGQYEIRNDNTFPIDVDIHVSGAVLA